MIETEGLGVVRGSEGHGSCREFENSERREKRDLKKKNEKSQYRIRKETSIFCFLFFIYGDGKGRGGTRYGIKEGDNQRGPERAKEREGLPLPSLPLRAEAPRSFFHLPFC